MVMWQEVTGRSNRQGVVVAGGVRLNLFHDALNKHECLDLD